MDKKSVEEIKFKITHSEDEKLGISLTRCTVVDNGNIVYDTTMPTRYFLHNNTMYRWLFELNNDASNSTLIYKQLYLQKKEVTIKATSFPMEEKFIFY